MGAPVPEMKAADDSTAELLLSAFRTIAAAERRKHATVFNYWLSIRGDRPFPPIRDLDPLEISDAGPFSLLLEMIGGGDDAEIRHIGQAIKNGSAVEKIGEAPSPSLLSCIAGKLPIVASSRQAFAFEEEFETAEGPMRCWVTLLPFSTTGTWVDYVYGFVTLAPASGAAARAEVPAGPVEEALPIEPGTEEPPEPDAAGVEEDAEPAAPAVEEEPEVEEVSDPVVEEAAEPEPEPEREPEEVPGSVADAVSTAEPQPEPDPQPRHEPEPIESGRPGFSKIFEALAGVSGFYGTNMKVEPNLPEARPAPPPEPKNPDVPVRPVEGSLQTKLTEVRAKADEARAAKLRANAALYEGLSAAYDFALDAEENAEEYLKLVEAQGLKIQLRSPMKPVVKLAFDGMCDDSTIGQLEAVLAWALKNDLPRGTLAERLEEEGGIGAVLNGQAKAA